MSEAFGEVDEGSIRSEIRGGADDFKAREATTMTSEDTSASDPIQLHRDHPWLTAAELAAEVGCSERTIYRRVSRGEIERLETGDGARFRVPRLSREVSVTVSQKGLSVTSSELTDSLSDPVVVEVDGGVSHPVSHCQSPCQSPCQSSVSDTLSVTGRPGAVNLELVRLVGELSRELSHLQSCRMDALKQRSQSNADLGSSSADFGAVPSAAGEAPGGKGVDEADEDDAFARVHLST